MGKNWPKKRANGFPPHSIPKPYFFIVAHLDAEHLPDAVHSLVCRVDVRDDHALTHLECELTQVGGRFWKSAEMSKEGMRKTAKYRIFAFLN